LRTDSRVYASVPDDHQYNDKKVWEIWDDISLDFMREFTIDSVYLGETMEADIWVKLTFIINSKWIRITQSVCFNFCVHLRWLLSLNLKEESKIRTM
jgi:hypothetical protein